MFYNYYLNSMQISLETPFLALGELYKIARWLLKWQRLDQAPDLMWHFTQYSAQKFIYSTLSWTLNNANVSMWLKHETQIKDTSIWQYLTATLNFIEECENPNILQPVHFNFIWFKKNPIWQRFNCPKIPYKATLIV